MQDERVRSPARATDLTAEMVVCSWFVLFFSVALNVQSASALVKGTPSDQWMPFRRWNVIVLPSFETSAPVASDLLEVGALILVLEPDELVVVA